MFDYRALLEIQLSVDFVRVVQYKLQSDADGRDNWSRRNKLPIHYGKLTCTTLGSRYKIQKAGKLNIIIGDTPINSVSSQKLLGLDTDKTLSWNPHIDYVCSIISSRISFLKQVSHYVAENIQNMFYQSYILPMIDYGSNLGVPHQNTNIERVNKVQKKWQRVLF